MLSRLCAGWLSILIVLPFAAPFSTCDLAALVHSVTRHSASGEQLTLGSFTSFETRTATHALPNHRPKHREQLVAAGGPLQDSPVPASDIVTDRVTTPAAGTSSISTPLRC